jgi:hypothetical protein
LIKIYDPRAVAFREAIRKIVLAENATLKVPFLHGLEPFLISSLSSKCFVAGKV